MIRRKLNQIEKTEKTRIRIATALILKQHHIASGLSIIITLLANVITRLVYQPTTAYELMLDNMRDIISYGSIFLFWVLYNNLTIKMLAKKYNIEYIGYKRLCKDKITQLYIPYFIWGVLIVTHVALMLYNLKIIKIYPI